MGIGITDFIPGVSNVKGLVQGHPLQALTGLPVEKGYDALKPKPVSTTPLTDAQSRTGTEQDFFHKQLVNLPQQYNPAQQQQLYNQGQGAIGLLQGAAAGTAPSAAVAFGSWVAPWATGAATGGKSPSMGLGASWGTTTGGGGATGGAAPAGFGPATPSAWSARR